jgi:putative heme-binding domain-containing protein
MQRLRFVLFLLLLAPLVRLDAGEPPNGEGIFDSNCAGCHGTGGAGGRGPSLRGPLRNGNQSSDIKNVIINGLPGTGMPKFHFDEDDLRAIIPYVQSLSQATASPSHPAGDQAEGKRIYDSHGCSGCHKIGSEGSALGPNLTRVGAARSYEYLKTSILNPSSDVPESYQAITVTTADGKRYRGVRVNEDSFTIQLRLPDQSFASFDKQAIQREVVEKESLMPAYQFDNKDMRNLLAYLSGLVGSATTAAGIKVEPRRR